MNHANEISQTGTVSVMFLGILVGLGFLQQAYFDVAFTNPILVVIALVPILFYLASTGRLQRFSGGGFEIVLHEQARKFVSPDGSETIEVDPERLDPKIRVSALEEIERRSPTALTFELGREGFYNASAIQDYLDSLGTLRHVVFTDAGDRFQGYASVVDFDRLLENYEIDVVGEIERGDIVDREIVRTESIPSDSTNEACLRAMDVHDVDELAAVDADRRFVGVVTQDAVIRTLMSAALTQV